ncbi:MAG: isoprenylcysteine carboxylmethyltransferase family protein [Pseudobdellovibrionaceae bacterium]
MFWIFSPYLLQFHTDDRFRILGFIFCYFGLFLSVISLVYLGRNYSPCFDSHIPFKLITNGPYKYIRHPGWLSKFIVGIGGILVSGSWWFIPVLLWLYIEMRRTISIEEAYLLDNFSDYKSYRDKTFCKKAIPFG